MDNNDPDCGFNWTWSVWLCLWSFTINKHIDVRTQIKLTFTVRHVQRQLERNCHRRKRTETALKPRTFALSWKLSEMSNYTSSRTLTDNDDTQRSYTTIHLRLAGPYAHMLVARWTCIPQSHSSSLKVRVLTGRCIPVRPWPHVWQLETKDHEWGQ